MKTVPPSHIDRREVIKWMLTVATSIAVFERSALVATEPGTRVATGYGTDPDLTKIYKPGDLWPLTFTETQRTTAAALCDVIVPADSRGLGASSISVQDFIDEWISAPYPGHDADRRTVVDGLVWLDAEAQRRFSNNFFNLIADQKKEICDDICYAPKAKPEFRDAARFFKKFRDLTADGYYTTPEGMKDIGYTGNVPLATFDGPSPEVLKKLSLA